MPFYLLCVVVISFYAALWFFDYFFKSCMPYPYYAFLEGTGLKVGIFNLSWLTTAFNRPIYRWGKNLSRPLKKWFAAGYIITIGLFLPFTLWTLVSLISDNFFARVQTKDGIKVEAMLPGVNIPSSEFWVYFMAIGLSSTLHELGHALAAVQDDIQVLAVGVYVFLIIPVAFVQFNTELLTSLPPSKRLRIYCAGVWHNIVVAFFALLLYFSTPILFSFAYESDVGVRVVNFNSYSPLNYVRGLQIGDIVTSANGCDIKNTKDWNYCLHMAYDRYGICTDAQFVALNDVSTLANVNEDGFVECCPKENSFHFCFEYMEDENEELNYAGQYTCLKPRDMVADKLIKCSKKTNYICPRSNHCLRPALNNRTYLIIINRKDNNPVIYLGSPYEVHNTVIVDQYFARLSMFTLFSPTKFETFLRYVFMFSLGIGFLNIIPCYGTDGYHIFMCLIQIFAFYFKKNDEFVKIVSVIVVVLGTLFTVPTLLLLFYNAIALSE